MVWPPLAKVPECTMHRADMQLKVDIEDELRRDPRVDPALIGVGVMEGCVSLIGVVDTYAARCAAEAATKRVPGVGAVAQNLRVRSLSNHEHGDSELGAATESVLESRVEVPRTVTALRRQATEDAKAISNAESAAWSVSGVFEVIDQVRGLTVIL
jgi:osmotically-inducible protein OsmY